MHQPFPRVHRYTRLWTLLIHATAKMRRTGVQAHRPKTWRGPRGIESSRAGVTSRWHGAATSENSWLATRVAWHGRCRRAPRSAPARFWTNRTSRGISGRSPSAKSDPPTRCRHVGRADLSIGLGSRNSRRNNRRLAFVAKISLVCTSICQWMDAAANQLLFTIMDVFPVSQNKYK